MHVRSMLTVIGRLAVLAGIAVILMHSTSSTPMVVAVVMVAIMNVARLAIRVGVNDEPGERAGWSGQCLADPRRDCEDERNQPRQVATSSSCLPQWDQHT